MGNVLTSARGLAQFYADLHTNKLISRASLAQMLTFQPLTVGTVPPAGTYYGLGQMITEPWTLGINRSLTLVGHPGMDWGSGFQSAHWVHELNMSFAIGFNMGESPSGMNSSLTFTQNAQFVAASTCRLLDVLLTFRGQIGLNCSHLIPP